MSYTYFTDEEVAGLDPDFVRRLDDAREIAGVPFVITSGYRTPEANARVGGGPAHPSRTAVDLRVRSSRHMYAIVRALFLVGFTRIGLYTGRDPKRWTHLHVDAAPGLPEMVLWPGKSR